MAKTNDFYETPTIEDCNLKLWIYYLRKMSDCAVAKGTGQNHPLLFISKNYVINKMKVEFNKI